MTGAIEYNRSESNEIFDPEWLKKKSLFLSGVDPAAGLSKHTLE